MPEDSLRRLDGTTISITDADAFARRILDAARVTGAQLVVLDRARLAWSVAFGLRRREPALPMDRQTTTWAASLTKSVFATYALQLAERGEIHLDTPLARQLRKPLDAYDSYRVLAAPDTYQTAAAELVRDPAWLTVTPRHLLSHTSGLANFAGLEPDRKLRLHFPPGTRYYYSGEGINLVQVLIEEVKGRPLDQLLQDALFAPLGMTRTGLIYRSEFAENVADRYGADEQFLSQTRRFPARASGSLTASAEDLGRFAAALLSGKLLAPASFKALLRPVVAIRSRRQFPRTPEEEAGGSEAAAVGLAYGTGWGLLTRTRFGPALFKEGHGDGAQNYMIFFPRRRAGMILLTNSDNGERAFCPLLETILGDTVTPWEWEEYPAWPGPLPSPTARLNDFSP